MNDLSEENSHSDRNAHEAEPTDLQCGISVKGLTKVYKVSYEIQYNFVMDGKKNFVAIVNIDSN